MTFWMGVTVCYVLIIGIGLALGHFLAAQFPDRGDGGHGVGPATPAPTGPTHALAACPPLGSAFDRALLPGVFDAEPATERA